MQDTSLVDYTEVVFSQEKKSQEIKEQIGQQLLTTGNLANYRYLVSWTKEKIDCYDLQNKVECFPCIQRQILQDQCGPETFVAKKIVLPSSQDTQAAVLGNLERKA